jgi:D-cysteine desulfhydrase
VNYPKRLSLANLPTPIHKLSRLSAQLGVNLYVWRDDMTGCVESGNKVRKLEFLLADALAQKATRIVTAGGVQSNHTRATAFCARRLGLDLSIIVRESKQGPEGELPTGNLLLNQMAGADLKFISYADYRQAGAVYQPFLDAEAENARRRGETPYVIPAGGSVPMGCWGYIAAVEELLATWRATGAGTTCPDALFFAVGSGGTHAGLYLGYEQRSLPVETLWAINVSDSAEYFQERVGALIRETATQFGLRSAASPRLQIFDGHFGEGYALASEDDFRFYAQLAREEGILLDPVYTGKAFRGMLSELRKDAKRFGRNILFLHSGGVFAHYAYLAQLGQALAQSDA